MVPMALEYVRPSNWGIRERESVIFTQTPREDEFLVKQEDSKYTNLLKAIPHDVQVFPGESSNHELGKQRLNRFRPD
jgi:hypothetical protein